MTNGNPQPNVFIEQPSKGSQPIPWWAKALIGTGVAIGGGVAAYEIINHFINPTPIPPPNLAALLAEKTSLAATWTTTYNNFTVNGTVALSTAQIASLKVISQQQQTVQNTITLEYGKELATQEAMSDAFINGIVEALLGIGAIFGSVALVKAWWNRPKTPPKGGAPQAPKDQLVAALNASVLYTSTYKYAPITYTEEAIMVEALSYAYQVAGLTSQAINILNAYIPIANDNYSNIQIQMQTLSSMYVAGTIAQTDFTSSMVALDAIAASFINLLLVYSIEGFSMTVGAFENITVDEIVQADIIAGITAMAIIALYYGIVAFTTTAGEAAIEIAPVILAA